MMSKYTYFILALFFLCSFLSSDTTAQKKKVVRPATKKVTKKVTRDKRITKDVQPLRPGQGEKESLVRRDREPRSAIKRDKKLTPEQKCKNVKSKAMSRYKRQCKGDVKCLEGIEKRAQIQYEKCLAAAKKSTARDSRIKKMRGKLRQKK
jgi:hypothetical protein